MDRTSTATTSTTNTASATTSSTTTSTTCQATVKLLHEPVNTNATRCSLETK